MHITGCFPIRFVNDIFLAVLFCSFELICQSLQLTTTMFAVPHLPIWDFWAQSTSGRSNCCSLGTNPCTCREKSPDSTSFRPRHCQHHRQHCRRHRQRRCPRHRWEPKQCRRRCPAAGWRCFRRSWRLCRSRKAAPTKFPRPEEKLQDFKVINDYTRS